MLRKAADGTAPSSFGTHVAFLAGVPSHVVKRAQEVSQDFAEKFKKRQASRRATELPLAAQADFSFLYKVASGSRVYGNCVQMREVLRTLSDQFREPFSCGAVGQGSG